MIFNLGKGPSNIHTSLLVLNYTMNESSPLLAQQPKIVRELSSKFPRIYVLTGTKGNFSSAPNVTVWSVRWGEIPRIFSMTLVYFYLLKYLVSDKGRVFTHMNDAFAALVAPVLWITRTPHFLWYAHKRKSLFIRFAKPFLSGILSSTNGSCPYRGRNVFFIGQGIDERDFTRTVQRSPRPLNRGFHYGRFDQSKRIEKMISETLLIRAINDDFTFSQIGGPSSQLNENYYDSVKSNFSSVIGSAVEIYPFIERERIPEMISTYDVFLHAYEGSLDKTLVETTLLEIPVLTENDEYLNIFGLWGSASSKNISEQYSALISMSDNEIEEEIAKRRRYMLDNYSLSEWINRLVKIIYDKR